MTTPTVVQGMHGPIHVYIGECCREWPLAMGFPVGRCGLCGERPTYKREDS